MVPHGRHVTVAGGDDERALDAWRSIIDEFEGAEKARESYLPYLFVNDANIRQGVIAHYGEGNVRRLKKVQEECGPDGVFHKLVAGGFKISF
ncbi:hypothetical protein DL767_006423 [Monosporascus sp. MG133]|nr:hypothetical protein DL767_006423 [Monosporascus sp. MG133]